MNFATLQGLTIPEGVVTQIADASGRVLWVMSSGDKVVLEVEKITSDTYAGETTYTGEQFILLDIYPKTNGTVKVTYGGLTKTITDTSGAEEPNAQQVFFGTFNGVSDSVTTPASGELTIEGDYYAFGCGAYAESSKDILTPYCVCVTKITSWGGISVIPDHAFSSATEGCQLEPTLEIPRGVKRLGQTSFAHCGLESVVIGKDVEFIGHQAFVESSTDNYQPSLRTVRVLATAPPEIGTYTFDSGEVTQYLFAPRDTASFAIEEIIVNKGCSNAYKTAPGWSQYADLIVEVS